MSEERPTADHYERLGVAPSASTEEVRAAYRSLARRLHPDRLGDASDGERALAERRMREINDSWRVLQDPGSRRRFDEGRLEGRRHTAARPSGVRVHDDGDDDLVEVLPPMTAVHAGLMRHLPWVVLLVLLGGIFVFSAYATADRTAPKPPAASTCLNVHGGTSTTMVPCSDPHDLQVLARVTDPVECPADTEARRLERSGIFDCVIKGNR